MTEILDLLDQVHVLLDEVVRVDRATLSDDDLVAVLRADERVGRLVDAARVVDAGETAHPRLPTAKIASPVRAARAGPLRRAMNAAGTATQASTRLNATRTHATAPTETPKSR